jgi:hypothetical protein
VERQSLALRIAMNLIDDILPWVVFLLGLSLPMLAIGARPRRIASLYVGRRDGDRLIYAGKARSDG